MSDPRTCKSLTSDGRTSLIIREASSSQSKALTLLHLRSACTTTLSASPQRSSQSSTVSCGISQIATFAKRMYDNLVSFPTEVIPIFDRELWNISMRELKDEPEDLGTCQVQIHDLLDKEQKIMRSMNPSDIEHLISLKGIVIRCSDLMP